MIKMVYCITKRDDVDADEFYRTWLEDHGPLVKSLASDLNAVRYVQSHTILPSINELLRVGRAGLQEPYDGITEVWWNSREDLERALQTPEGQKAAALLAEDEARMADFSKCRVFMTQEHDIF
ncbi:EthD domain-containing protein [Pseudomonadota bacterium]